MASSSSPMSLYGPISGPILDGFESEEDLSTSTLELSTTPPARSTTAFRYKAPSASLFGGFDGDTTNESAVQGTRNQPMEDSPEDSATVCRPFPISLSPGFGARPDSSNGMKTQSTSRAPPTSLSSSTLSVHSPNPYSSLIDSRQNAMAGDSLQNSEGSVVSDDPPEYPTDDFGLGQRYQVVGQEPAVVITNQRLPAEILSGEMDCAVCAHTKVVSEFPGAAVTKTCTHPPATCLECVAMSIRSDLNTKLWNEIRCPECGELLQYDDVQKYADSETRERYQDFSFRHAVSEAANFMWCTANCGYGQVHDGGVEEPIVICLLCSGRSCFYHKVAWHENLTCDEYDRLLDDPGNFRSRFELENAAADEAAAARRAQEDADHAFAGNLMAEEKRANGQVRQDRSQKKREEQLAREEAEREERKAKADLVRQEAAKHKEEEEKSQRTVAMTSKPCPGCGWAIEKNAGCSHMTCIKCGHQFCYDCLADHRQIIKKDNAVHKGTCPWHPDNIKD